VYEGRREGKGKRKKNKIKKRATMLILEHIVNSRMKVLEQINK